MENKVIFFIGIIVFALCAFLLHRIFKLQKTIFLKNEEIKNSVEKEKTLSVKIHGLEDTINNLTFDPITHLLGWQLFEDRVNQQIIESARYKFEMAILFIDIDNFKVINEALTYEIGNLLLVEVAQRIKNCVRQMDSVSRLMKDTFVVLLSQLNKAETAAIIAQRLLQAFSEPFVINEHELYITASIGIALYPTDSVEINFLLRNAEQALYVAKKKGGQIYQFYQEKTHANSQRELLLYNSLQRETIFQELILNFRPIVDTKNKNIFCIQSVLSWRHPVLGMIDSKEFFQRIEKQNKINAISAWELKSAIQHYFEWQAKTKLNFFLSIPISIKQLENSQFIYRISQIMRENNFEPQSLILIVKVTAPDFSLELIEKAFNMFKYMGVKIVIDNFGGQHIALSDLNRLSFYGVTLHPSFIQDIDDSPHQQKLLAALILLAKNLSLKVIAKGVDTATQMSTLKELGCYLIEGDYIGTLFNTQEVENLFNQISTTPTPI